MSKHSSRREEQTAWDAGTVPFGPRNFPSTRLLHAVIAVFQGGDHKGIAENVGVKVVQVFRVQSHVILHKRG